jgi:hypothetical protein
MLKGKKCKEVRRVQKCTMSKKGKKYALGRTTDASQEKISFSEVNQCRNIVFWTP